LFTNRKMKREAHSDNQYSRKELTKKIAELLNQLL
jgi:hypothetical protein